VGKNFSVAEIVAVLKEELCLVVAAAYTTTIKI
jgi:hypothetical protein